MLRRRSPAVQLCGVDPSDVMVTQAARRNPGADLRLGAAAAIPFPKGHADIVLSVNNMPMWPDLAAGLHEVGRVLAPNGTALFAWHGGEDPRGHQRRLVLPPQRLEELDSAIRERFEHARLRRLRRSDLWEASGPRRFDRA